MTKKLIAKGENKYNLTQRELDVLKLLAFGKKNKEIADDLNITYHTVKVNISDLAKKLFVHGRTSIVVKAVSEKLIDI